MTAEHEVSELRTRMGESATLTRLPGDAGARAWSAGRRRHRRRVLVRAGVAALGVVLIAAGGLVVSRSVGSAPPPSVLAGQLGGALLAPDPGLDAVHLPDPAPGFPVRRQPDRPATSTGGHLVKLFLVGVARRTAQATVEVARAGTLTPDSGVTDTGTTTVRGRPAQVRRGPAGTTVTATVGGFDLRASGPVPAAQLTVLLDSLTGIPGGAR